MRFTEYVPEYDETAKFSIRATPSDVIEKTEDLGTDAFGFGMARYRLPEMIYNSTTGRYSVFGGTVSVTCFHTTMGIAGLNWRVDLQLIYAWDYQGLYGQGNPIRRNQTSIMGGDGGWAFQNSAGSSNGFGASWQEALDSYLTYGGCTSGWVIFVDGVEKCDVRGHPVNQT